eukprot:5688368-Pyramimonas_sp.AAC.1
MALTSGKWQEVGRCSKCTCRLSVARTRGISAPPKTSRMEDGWFSTVFALASRTHVISCARNSWVEGGWFSKCGSRLTAGRILF